MVGIEGWQTPNFLFASGKLPRDQKPRNPLEILVFGCALLGFIFAGLSQTEEAKSIRLGLPQVARQ